MPVMAWRKQDSPRYLSEGFSCVFVCSAETGHHIHHISPDQVVLYISVSKEEECMTKSELTPLPVYDLSTPCPHPLLIYKWVAS